MGGVLLPRRCRKFKQLARGVEPYRGVPPTMESCRHFVERLVAPALVSVRKKKDV